jgi:predicted nucleic acid-binding Zn ribbon protein
MVSANRILRKEIMNDEVDDEILVKLRKRNESRMKTWVTVIFAVILLILIGFLLRGY